MNRIRGASLIEVLIALMVGAIALIGALQLLQTVGLLASQQQSVVKNKIVVQESLLMLTADLERAQPVQSGAQRVVIRETDNGYRLKLARDAVTVRNSEPQLLEVTWSLGRNGIERTISTDGGLTNTRQLIAQPTRVVLGSEDNTVAGLRQLIIQLDGRDYWLWFNVQ